MELSVGEKLILLMLSDIHELLEIEDGIDPHLVRKAIYGENLWSLAWQYPGLVRDSGSDTPPVVREVLDILDMWEALEYSYSQLQPAGKARVKAEAKRFGNDVRFRGFDGNNETEYMGTVDVLVNDLGRYATFKGRDLNSHMPTVDTYQEMRKVYSPISRSLDGPLTVAQIIQVLNA